MALSLVGSTGNATTNGGNVTITYPTTTAAGDVVYVYGGHFRNSATSTDAGPTLSASFTQIADVLVATSSNCCFGVWRRVLPAAEATVLCLGTGRSSDATAYGAMVFRGVSTGVPEGGVTSVTAGSTVANPNPPAITAPSGNNWVVAASGNLISDTTPGTVASSSGGSFTALGNFNASDNFPMSVAAAYWSSAVRSVSRDPGAWSTWSAGSNASITFVVHEADQLLVPALIADTDAFNTAAVSYAQTITATLLADTDSFTTAVLTEFLTPALVADADSFGTATIVQIATPVLYSDTDSFGTASVTSEATIAPTLYGDTDSLGTAAVTSLYYITASCYSELDIAPQFLLHADGQDGQQIFIDATGRHVVGFSQTVQLDTSQAKFGPSSVFCDGDDDYLILDGSSDFDFGTGDFTIDMWVRLPGDWSAGGYLYDSRPDSTQGPPAIAINGSALLEYVANGAVYITGTTPLAPNQWYHVAVTRYNTLVRLFLDGVEEGQAADATAHGISANRPLIGGHGYTPTSDSHYGWIDEVRVIKWTAAWTANFTPPTSLYGLGIETVYDPEDVSFIITPTLYSDTDSFGTASITIVLVPSDVTIAPVLYSDSDTVFSPSVYNDRITPTLYDDADIFFLVDSDFIGFPIGLTYTELTTQTVTVTTFFEPAPVLFEDQDTFYTGPAYNMVISGGTVTTGDFTVSGQAVSDLFTHSGVVYPYAPVERRTN